MLSFSFITGIAPNSKSFSKEFERFALRSSLSKSLRVMSS